MSPPPIPERLPTLAWRVPAILWTPLALALAIGWPALLFMDDPGVQRATLAIGATAFAGALGSLGASWALGRAPKARRIVVLHVVIAGALASLAAPFAFAHLFADQQDLGAALTLTPLTLLLGLPIALASGIIFAWIALTTPRAPRSHIMVQDVQPFQ
jgi:hypothetical protein